MDKTTMDTALEDVLKEDIMPEICTEGKGVKVYGKIYGYTNLGRTFLVSEDEVYKSADDADKQMMQKYGKEIYDKYLKCSVTPLKELPDKFYEATGDFSALSKSLKDLENYLVRKSKEPVWFGKYGKDAQSIQQHIQKINTAKGASEAQASYKEIKKILTSEPWQSLTEGDLKKTFDSINKNWSAWAGKDSGSASTGGEGKTQRKEGNKDWNPRLPFLITVDVQFDEDWFKKQYKSGLINAAIRGLKTQAMKRSVGTAGQSSLSGHEWTYDHMEDSEKRKLDSIKWKMTNAVTKDYIMYLLGWSRKKVALKTKDGQTIAHPSEAVLRMDTGLGDKFAKNAMGGRGLLGRMRQKLFAGGTETGKIQAAFQLADPNDGWTVVDEKTGKTIASPDGGDGKGGADGKGSGTGGGSSKGGSGKSGSAGGGSSGKGGPGGGGNGEPGGGADLEKSDLKNVLNMLQRVERIEKEVGIGPGAEGSKDDNKDKYGKDGNKTNKNKEKFSESIENDPFYEVFAEDVGHLEKVRHACENMRNVDALVDDFINNLV